MPARKARPLILAALCLLGGIVYAKDGATPKTTPRPKLELVPGSRVQVAPEFIAADSFIVRFRVATAAAEKFQRHRCLISANEKGYTLAASKAQQWMLRRDTLMVLSEVELTLRAPKALASSLALQFKFTNLDQPKQQNGVATLIIGRATPAARADSVTLKPVVAMIDSVRIPRAARSDSAQQTLAADSTHAAAQAEEGSGLMPWILIGLLLCGFAVMAWLSRLSDKQAREATEKIFTIRPMEPPKNSGREEQRPAAFDPLVRRRETPEPFAQARGEKEGEKISRAPASENAVPASSVLALAPRRNEEIFALPDLQSALAQLSAVTAEVQKAVGKQFEALQQLSAQVETAAMLPAQASSLQNQPRLQFAFDAQEAGAENKNTNGLEELGAPPQAGEKYEEIADAIASLAAASKIKTPPVSPQALAPKLELLQSLHAGLQALAAFCRANATGVAPESVESLSRKVLDLRTSYEAWASDQTSKLPLMLQRPQPNGSGNARHKIVESLLEGLYETRKLAAQGGLYFERRLAQLLEQDLPKLRSQFESSGNAELQKILQRLA